MGRCIFALSGQHFGTITTQHCITFGAHSSCSLIHAPFMYLDFFFGAYFLHCCLLF